MSKMNNEPLKKMNVKFDLGNVKIRTKNVSYKSIIEQAMSWSYLAQYIMAYLRHCLKILKYPVKLNIQ